MIVVKLGGAAGIDFRHLVTDIAAFVADGEKIIVVHGGSDAANSLTKKLGMVSRHITSPSGVQSRYTDRAAVEVLLMACAGHLNKLIVEALHQAGVNAWGLTGLDGRLLVGSRKKAVKAIEGGRTIIIRDDQSGRLESVNADLFYMLLEAGFTPVVSALALSREGTALNVDADRVAAKIAGAVGADQLFLLTNVPGLLVDVNNPSSVIRQANMGNLSTCWELARGRMKKKVIAAEEALKDGVREVVIADGRVEHPLQAAQDGKGTVITA
jgi:acetylglutamate/LysW-gamma-L-alpha-aminoadipate kinase